MTVRILDRITGAVIGALALALIAVLAGVIDAGPLDPPGAPGSTDGVRQPGTPIDSLPFVTTGSGHYYLTRNVTGVSGEHGITIDHDNVTLDLNGFTMAGVSGSMHGVSVLPTHKNITVSGGVITGWGESGIFAFANDSSFHDLHVSDNGGYGIVAGSRVLIHDVTSRDNVLDGISVSANSIVQRCTAFSNDGAGIVVNASVVSECTAAANGGDGVSAAQRSTVRGNSIESNGGDGIRILSASLVEQNTLVLNGQQVADGAGIHATGSFNRIVNNLLTNNDSGIDVDVGGSSLISGNHAANNVDDYGQIVAGNLRGPTLTGATIDDAGANPHANFAP